MKYISDYRIRHITPNSSRVVKHLKKASDVDIFLYQLSHKLCASYVTEYDIKNYGITKYELEKWDDNYRQWVNVCHIESSDGNTWRSYKN